MTRRASLPLQSLGPLIALHLIAAGAATPLPAHQLLDGGSADAQNVDGADPSTITHDLRDPPESDALDGVWKLLELDGVDVRTLLDGPRRHEFVPGLKISLESMSIGGRGVCNTYFGGIANVSSTEITLGGIGATMMLCKQYQDLENAYFKALAADTFTWDILPGNKMDLYRLVLRDDEGNHTLVFRKPFPSKPTKPLPKLLSGDWVLKTMMVNGSVPEKYDSASGFAPTLNLAVADKKISGAAACNTYAAGIVKASSDGDIAFGAIAATRKLCLKNGNLEMDYLDALQMVATYDIRPANRLELANLWLFGNLTDGTESALVYAKPFPPNVPSA
jgi:heat shock protein HslJ